MPGFGGKAIVSAGFMRLLFALLFALLLPPCAPAVAAAESTGLPLPRFVSLRSDPINLRSGPGERYPVDWVYSRRHLPVEVVAEFETWRKIRDWEGTEGWVHQSLLSGQRTVLITGQTRALRAGADDGAAIVALVEPGVIGRLSQCPLDDGYCRVDLGSLRGWLRRDEFYGLYDGENLE